MMKIAFLHIGNSVYSLLPFSTWAMLFLALWPITKAYISLPNERKAGRRTFHVTKIGIS